MSTIQKSILISGARAPIALEMARSFKQAGHRVILVDCQHWTIGRWSNAVDRYYVIPPPRWDSLGFVAALQGIIEKEQVGHVIPTCEEALWIAAHRHALAAEVWTADLETMVGLHNKYHFSQAYKNHLPIPETVLLSEFEDWAHSQDYVFKPIYSRFATSVFVGQKLEAAHFKEADKPHWIAQRLIRGREICVYSIWSRGQLRAFALYHPLYRAGKGAGIFFEPLENQVVFDYVQRFGAALGYHGQLCFDVILDQDERPYFIECNPRGTSGAHLLNRALASAFLGEGLQVPPSSPEFAIKYLMAMMQPKAFFSPRVRQARDVVFAASDLKPFFLQALSLLEISYIKWKNNCTWLGATTEDIEWNGE